MEVDSFPWVFTDEEVANSASRADRVTLDTEANYRRATSAFIVSAGNVLFSPDARQSAISHALLYCNWFFVLQSFRRHDRYVCKVSDNNTKLDVVLKVVGKTIRRSSGVGLQDSTDAQLKERLCIKEKIVLHTTGFCVSLQLPYKTVDDMCMQLFTSGDFRRDDAKEVAHVAHSLVLDALRSTAAVRFTPREIALATTWVASKILKNYLPRGWVARLVRTPDSVARVEACIDAILAVFEGDNRGVVAAPQASPTPSEGGASGAAMPAAP